MREGGTEGSVPWRQKMQVYKWGKVCCHSTLNPLYSDSLWLLVSGIMLILHLSYSDFEPHVIFSGILLPQDCAILMRLNVADWKDCLCTWRIGKSSSSWGNLYITTASNSGLLENVARWAVVTVLEETSILQGKVTHLVCAPNQSRCCCTATESFNTTK